MKQNGSFRDKDWRRPRGRGGPGRHGDAAQLEQLADLAVQAGLWAAGCLAIASLAPAVLVAPLLRDFLLVSAFVVCVIGLLHDERLSLERFNRHDLALALVVLALVADLFVDPAAVEAFTQAQADAASGAGVFGQAG